MKTASQCDILITSATVFDGFGGPARSVDVAIKGGRIEAIDEDLSHITAIEKIDAQGKWLMPGLLDIHTHFDLEVELAPHLPEAVRHGTTTVVASNCSLGLAFGNQRKNGEDPIVDCFARVENIPKHVLAKVAEKATWTDSAQYLDHLDSLPLGPNIVPLVPHSMLRIEVMGLDRSIKGDASNEELGAMEGLVEKAMEEGYVGFSTDAMPFHYLANQPNHRSRIPGQYGSFKELRRLTDILRRYDRVWQATPPKDSPLGVFKTFTLTSGRLYKKPLRLTAVAAMDVASNKMLVKLGRFLARFLNSRLMRGHFLLQTLAAPFKVWGEGPLTPLSEEIPELRELNEPDLEDRAARRRILADPDWQARFKAMWFDGKRGFSLSRLKRVLNREDYTITRNLCDMVIDRCPVSSWVGLDMETVYKRILAAKAGDKTAAEGKEERAEIAALSSHIENEADFLIALLDRYDTDLYWYTISANRNPDVLRDLVMDPGLIPGFNDSGAHLTNMAFYDGNLRALQMAQREGEQAVAFTVARLTRKPAEFFNIDAGRIEEGARADLTLIDPESLATYDSEANTLLIHRDAFDHHQLVNRSDGVVPLVIINGRIAWQGTEFVSGLGKDRGYGACLRALNHVDEAIALAAE